MPIAQDPSNRHGVKPTRSETRRGQEDTRTADCHRQVRDGLLEYPAQFPERPKEDDAPALRALNDCNVALGAVTNYGVLGRSGKTLSELPILRKPECRLKDRFDLPRGSELLNGMNLSTSNVPPRVRRFGRDRASAVTVRRDSRAARSLRIETN